MSGRNVLICLFSACLLGLGCVPLSASPAVQPESSCEETWHWANPLPQGNMLLVAAYNGTTYVVTGAGGTVMTSTDGLKWTYQCIGANDGLQGVAAGPDRFVVGSTGGGIWESTDGSAWTRVEEDFFLYGVWAMTYANGRYIAVGGKGNISTSIDGIHWTPVISLSPTDSITSVTFGNGVYVATGFEGSVWTSPDAAQWTRQPSVLSVPTNRVVFGGGRFLACGTGGQIWTSPDGRSWTRQASPTTENIYSATWDGVRFVALTVYGLMLTSSDGASWTTGARIGGGSVTFGIAYLGERYLVMGAVSLLISDDLLAWHDIIADVTGLQGGGSLLSVQHGGIPPGHFAVVGAYGVTMTSPNGLHWTPHPSGVTSNLWGLAWGNGLFVAVGEGGTILTSPDAEVWTRRSSTTGSALFTATYAASLWVAAGAQGLVLTSPDGFTWTPHKVPGSPWFASISYGNGRFVGVGYSGIIFSSPDAISWSPASLGAAETLLGVAYGNGFFVAVGDSGRVWTSGDGLLWEESPRLNSSRLFGVTFSVNRFLAASNDGEVFSSNDGRDWTEHMTLTPNSVVSVCEAGGMTVAVGAADDIQWNACALLLLTASPATGPLTGGIPVTLSGANFVEGARVFFGDLSATGVGFVDSTVLIAVAPAGGIGAVDVKVVNPGGSSATLPGGFRYTTAPVITGIQKLSAPLRLKVSGVGFLPGCSVGINGVPVSTVYKGEGKAFAEGIKALIPKGITVQITVTNPEGGTSSPFPFTR